MSLQLLALVLLAQEPDWQAAAGGKMAFEVASVKLDTGDFKSPSFPLDAGDAYKPTGGRFSADFSLATYITFAYKLNLTPEQRQEMIAALPKWVASDRFEILAKSEQPNPTKDQMRLMMQSLLADRFKLAVHFETREVPLLALTVIKPGKLGPNLKPHSEGPSCDGTADAFPPRCDVFTLMFKDGLNTAGSRNTTLPLIASGLPGLGRLSRPVVDRTGLDGRFDFVLKWLPDSDPPSDLDAPGFNEALKEQLGLKLETTKGPIQVLVVDHVEKLTEN